MEVCGRSRVSKEGTRYGGEGGQVTMGGKRKFGEEVDIEHQKLQRLLCLMIKKLFLLHFTIY